jgi:flagellar basal body-associated protein FliL
MNQVNNQDNHKPPKKRTPSIWASILLLIILTFGLVALFGLIVFLFINGAERMGLPGAVHVAILVLISGVFAWLLKRLSDAISSLSHIWFPEDSDKQD